MRPGMDLLLPLLRGEVITAQPSSAEWQQTLDLAEQESVLPSCVAAIRRSAMPLPEQIAARLTAIERESTISTFWWTSELSGILAAFHEHSIPVIPLKGPFLAQRVYGDVRLRTSRDLDLLVRARDRKAAGALLSRLGFTADLRPDDYHHSWRRGTTLVELHHNVENPLAFHLGIKQLWSRALPGQFCGRPVLQLAPQDELLYLCLHGVRHRFERLSHVLDLAFAFDALKVSPDHLRADTSLALRPLLILGHAMARRLRPQLPHQLSDIGPAVSAAESAHQERIAAARWQALLHQPSSAPLDWHEQHRFYLELERTHWLRLKRSLRHLLILSTRLIQPDFDFAARYNVTQPAFVWIIRQLRLFTKAGSPARHPLR